MKNLGRSVSVIVLSFLLVLSCPFSVFAAYADRVKYTYLITSIGAPANDTAYPSGTQFYSFRYPRVYLFQIPDTSLGEQYIVSFDFDVMSPGNRLFNSPITRLNLLGGYVSQPGTVIAADGPLFSSGSSNEYTLYWGDSQNSSVYNQSFVIYGTSGTISHTLDAVDGTTYLSLGLGSLYISCMCSISNSWTMAAGEFGSLVIPTPQSDQSKQVGISLSNISVEKVVGSDELLNEMKKQTEIMEEQTDIFHQQTDALTKFDGSDQMDGLKASLDQSINRYDQVEDSIFTAASTHLDSFDIAANMKPSTGTLAALQFLAPIFAGLISSMGEFASLYTVGFTLVLITLIFGITKYFTSSTESFGVSPDKFSSWRRGSASVGGDKPHNFDANGRVGGG